jgi:hypothetical protein
MKSLVRWAAVLLLPCASALSAESAPKHVWKMGVETYYFVYEEPGVMLEEGFLAGLSFDYRFASGAGPVAGGSFRFCLGAVDYQNSGTLEDIPDLTFEIRGIAGRANPVSDAVTITPYAGFAYRYLNDDSGGMITSIGAAGYERESNYYYAPLGLEISRELSSGKVLAATIEFDLFFGGRQISHLSDADPGYNDPENEQNGGFGLRAAVESRYAAAEHKYAAAFFVRYWNIDRSDPEVVYYYGTPVGYGVEPENRSVEIGLSFALKF